MVAPLPGRRPVLCRDIKQASRSQADLSRARSNRWVTAALELIDDLLLSRQPAGDHVAFAPSFEGEAVDELLTVKADIGSAACAAMHSHRCRLSSGARRDLPGQTIEIRWISRRVPIAVAGGLKAQTSIMPHPPGIASR